MIRLAHISDIHVSAKPLGWRAEDWFTKRLSGWINYRLLGRGHRFRHTDVVLAALAEDFRARQPQHVIFSGDATALGFESEVARAAELLGLLSQEPLPGLAVPGNHDYYTKAVAQAGLIEKYFARWQTGERIGSDIYPFAQRVGHVWLIGLNTCTGNYFTWDAGGSADAAQLERLGQLRRRLDAGPKILVTHYPVCLASGEREARHHCLRNLPEVVEAAKQAGISLWLHGHRHHPYYLAQSTLAPFPVLCGGSTTQTGIWTYHEYEIEGEMLQATPRVFDLESKSFRAGKTFEVNLAAGNQNR